MRVRVRGDVGDAIALSDTHRLQERRPAITALEELSVRQPQFAVDDGFPVSVKPARATRKLHRRQGYFHWTVLLHVVGRRASAFSGRLSSSANSRMSSWFERALASQGHPMLCRGNCDVSY